MEKLNNLAKDLVANPKKMLTYIMLFGILGWVLLQVFGIIFAGSKDARELEKITDQIQELNKQIETK
jgi:hypothetical protein